MVLMSKELRLGLGGAPILPFEIPLFSGPPQVEPQKADTTRISDEEKQRLGLERPRQAYRLGALHVPNPQDHEQGAAKRKRSRFVAFTLGTIRGFQSLLGVEAWAATYAINGGFWNKIS